MDDPEIVQLLREIRDLQQQHVQNYKDALANQERSIAMQNAQVRRSRFLLPFLIAFLVLCLWLVFMSRR